MAGITPLVALLTRDPVLDIEVPGYVDRDGPYPRFVPLARTFYLRRRNDFVRCDVPPYEDYLTFRSVDRPERPATLEEDEEFATTSYAQLFLDEDRPDFTVTRIRSVLREGEHPSDTVVRCVEFEFENALALFADPGHFFGIRLQGRGAYDRWLAFAQAPDRPFGPLREVVWTPEA
ncbi:hypothetical protein EF910_18635 [Streptomyces sp. WAC07149]|uniref:hypothetical protein n=1 Tax=Streptomyces sp. WAC07149 TaxID=2487425 RepID=UPI000F792094|nr:hypothetical protein [Streptomyces sp. WAC07149]RST04149.1 hypothetical protein EF910_18635 [Streptomyces sp. WAC07149]